MIDQGNIVTTECRWINRDRRGLRLVEPYFGVSINGSPPVDVEGIVLMWKGRFEIKDEGE